MPRDAWIALAVAAASAVSLWDLWREPATGAFVKTTTFPMALAALLLLFALLLFATALFGRRRRRPVRAALDLGAMGRVTTLFVLTVLYISALPWFGYMVSSAMYFGAASLVFGNRQPVSIVVAMVAVPLALLLFFEKYMIVLLPSARLFG